MYYGNSMIPGTIDNTAAVCKTHFTLDALARGGLNENERKGKTKTFEINGHYYAVAIQKAYYRKIPGRKA